MTQQSKLSICSKYGARLVTTNNPSDAISKLKKNRIKGVVKNDKDCCNGYGRDYHTA